MKGQPSHEIYAIKLCVPSRSTAPQPPARLAWNSIIVKSQNIFVPHGKRNYVSRNLSRHHTPLSSHPLSSAFALHKVRWRVLPCTDEFLLGQASDRCDSRDSSRRIPILLVCLRTGTLELCRLYINYPIVHDAWRLRRFAVGHLSTERPSHDAHYHIFPVMLVVSCSCWESERSIGICVLLHAWHTAGYI